MPTKIAARIAPPQTAVDDDEHGPRPEFDQITIDALRVGIIPITVLALVLLVLKVVFYSKMGPNVGP